MDQLAGNGMGKVHMVVDLVADLVVAPVFFRDIAFLFNVLGYNALFINGCPVFYLALKFIYDITGIGFKVCYHLPPYPAVVFFH